MTAFMTAYTMDQKPPQHQRRRSSHESILSGLFSEAASVSSGRFLAGTGGESSLSNLLNLCAQKEDEHAEEHFIVSTVKNNSSSSACVKNDDADDELSLDLGTDEGANEPNVAVSSSKEHLGRNRPVAEVHVVQASVGENGPSASIRSSSIIEKVNNINEDNHNNSSSGSCSGSTEQSPIDDAVGLVGTTPSPSFESNFAAADDDEEESMSVGHEGTAPLSRPPTSTDARSQEQQAFDQQRRRNQQNEHYVACADEFLFDDDDYDDDDDDDDDDDSSPSDSDDDDEI